MSKKIIGIIIIFSGLVLLTGVVYLLFFRQSYWPSWLGFLKGKENAIVRVNNNLIPNLGSTTTSPTSSREVKKIIFTETKTEDKTEITKATKSEFSRQDLLRLAASFAERFGTYSNQSNFSNILGLKIFMSRRMKVWVNSYIREHQQTQMDNSIYYSITTKAVSQEFKDYDDDLGRSVVLVKTRRREASGSVSNVSDTFSQNILINFIKENGAWKVDSANWLDK